MMRWRLSSTMWLRHGYCCFSISEKSNEGDELWSSGPQGIGPRLRSGPCCQPVIPNCWITPIVSKITYHLLNNWPRSSTGRDFRLRDSFGGGRSVPEIWYLPTRSEHDTLVVPRFIEERYPQVSYTPRIVGTPRHCT